MSIPIAQFITPPHPPAPPRPTPPLSPLGVHMFVLYICVSILGQADSFLNRFIYLFIYFWLRWVFVAARGRLLFIAMRGLLIVVASLVAEHGL